MSGRLRASIVVIGDEILSGHVRDANSGWLAERLQAHGVPLDRVATVPDDEAAIGEHLDLELARSRPRVLLTSGGIGSTPDDRTLPAIASFLGRALVPEPSLDAAVTQRLDERAAAGRALDPAHAAALRSMALVPEGASLIGAGGFSSAVAVDLAGGSDATEGATIVVLPGIPGELQRITREAVEPELLAGRGQPVHTEELTHPFPESLLTPTLARLTEQHPGLHVGSYPGSEVVVRLSGPREEVTAAMDEVRAAVAALAAEPQAREQAASWAAYWEHGP